MYFKHKHLPNSKTYSVLVKPKIADFLLQIHRFSVFCLFCCLIMRNHNMYSGVVAVIVLISDGNSEIVAHARRKIGHLGEKHPICDFSRSNQMP